VRVVIAEDSVLLREGIVRLLREHGMEVVGSTDRADALLQQVAALRPDVAIVDIRLPPTHTDEGMRAALAIRSEHAGCAVLVLSQYVEVPLAMQLLGDSASGVGYLLKDRISDIGQFVDDVRRVAGGGSAIDPTIVSALIGKQRRSDPVDALTAREREVLLLMAQGKSNQGIADEFRITLRAVEKYVSSVFSKLDIPATSSDSRRVLAVLLHLRG
jgi:DNA-binding NarL/FixJ family response regulator